MCDSSIEGAVELDCNMRKLGPMSPTHSKHELYRSIQKGGSIPQHGLQLSTASDKTGVSLTIAVIKCDIGHVYVLSLGKTI